MKLGPWSEGHWRAPAERRRVDRTQRNRRLWNAAVDLALDAAIVAAVAGWTVLIAILVHALRSPL